MTVHHSPARSTRRRPVATRAALAGALAMVLAAALAPPAQARAGKGPVRYVALGDSYSSGPGIPDEADVNCGRSNRNYPSLVAQALGAASFTDVTCAGAETRHMAERQDSAPPQLDALRPDTTLVTLGIGGNDLGLTGVIARCVLVAGLDPGGAPCKASYTLLGSDGIGSRINATAPKVEAVLKEIHARSPRARVLLVGYPAIVPGDGTVCRDLIPFATGDFAWFGEKEEQLNSMLAQQANVYDATYVDLYGPSLGHDACKPEGTRWIEPATTEAAAGFHPNAAGHESAAAEVRAALTP
ncbi:SGNH/GDSL hydrolase family protein [Streptomyces sp. NPDC048172]|uniref:SGNH/GDSL hydrolase family protein n=1 Tax=Streptomyces sp. NPDC048172 TaxID=3365505 RepID=UPI003716A3A8